MPRCAGHQEVSTWMSSQDSWSKERGSPSDRCGWISSRPTSAGKTTWRSPTPTAGSSPSPWRRCASASPAVVAARPLRLHRLRPRRPDPDRRQLAVSDRPPQRYRPVRDRPGRAARPRAGHRGDPAHARLGLRRARPAQHHARGRGMERAGDRGLHQGRLPRGGAPPRRGAHHGPPPRRGLHGPARHGVPASKRVGAGRPRATGAPPSKQVGGSWWWAGSSSGPCSPNVG